jgi:Tfp pilus assembly protein PilV
MQASGNFAQNPEDARAWLTERADYHERREQITLLLEIAVAVLILIEIGLAIWQGHLQSVNFKDEQQAQTKNFNEQQQVLTTLQRNSETTANNLASLHTSIESTNTILQMQLDALKKSAAETARTAKAGEASASTASQALHVSERAYVHMTASLLKPPAAGERVHPIVVITNVGRTPALDVAALLFFSLVPASTPIKTARELESTYPRRELQSVYTLPAGQTSIIQTDSESPYLQSMVDQMTNGEAVLYVFATASYKDVFNQPHHTEICGFYQPKLNTFGACAEYNKSD